MPKIECLNGPTVQNVGGTNYSFVPDGRGRFVANVRNLVDAQMFLAVKDVYREVTEVVLESKPRNAIEPKGGKLAGSATGKGGRRTAKNTEKTEDPKKDKTATMPDDGDQPDNTGGETGGDNDPDGQE